MTRSAPRPAPRDEWVTVAVAAYLTGLTTRRIYQWIDEGLIAVKIENKRKVVLRQAAVRIGDGMTRGRPKHPKS